MTRKLVFVFCLITTPVFAQSTTPPTPSEQVLGAKLMLEINSGLACGTDLVTARAEIAKLQARVKELEPKVEEPKK